MVVGIRRDVIQWCKPTVTRQFRSGKVKLIRGEAEEGILYYMMIHGWNSGFAWLVMVNWLFILSFPMCFVVIHKMMLQSNFMLPSPLNHVLHFFIVDSLGCKIPSFFSPFFFLFWFIRRWRYFRILLRLLLWNSILFIAAILTL